MRVTGSITYVYTRTRTRTRTDTDTDTNTDTDTHTCTYTYSLSLTHTHAHEYIKRITHSHIRQWHTSSAHHSYNHMLIREHCIRVAGRVATNTHISARHCFATTTHTHMHTHAHIHTHTHTHTHILGTGKLTSDIHMGWLRLVGSLKL